MEDDFMFFDSSIFQLFSAIEDPRVLNRCQHNLLDVLVITVCSVLCGCETWDEIEMFANERFRWFSKYLELPNGIPSHDTFRRIFMIINVDEFEKIFFAWITSVQELTKGQVIAFDGKTLGGTGNGLTKHAEGKKPIATLNVWAVDDNVVIGQRGLKTTGSAELQSIKEAFDLFKIKGMVITVDAASAHPSFTEEVIKRGADYVMPIKISNKSFSKKLQEIFDSKDLVFDKAKAEIESNRGRKETRECWAIELDKLPPEFNQTQKSETYFEGLKTVARLTCTREEKDPRQVKQMQLENKSWKWVGVEKDSVRKVVFDRFILTSLKANAEEIKFKARQHWGIENNLHWSLDVAFREDDNRTRDKQAARNLALIRKLALNLLKKDKTPINSLKRKMKKCVWNEEYLEQVLFKTI